MPVEGIFTEGKEIFNVFNGKELVFIPSIFTKEASNLILKNSVLNNKI